MEFLRRRLGLIFRALVSILLIWWLLSKMNLPELWPILRTVRVGWLVAGLACFVPVLLVVSWRWRLLLSVHGVRLRFWRVIELSMIGQFFSAFLLGTTGGDVVKIYYVARAVPQRKAAVGFTVVVDRVIGLVALLLFGAAFALMQLPLLFSTHETKLFTGLFFLFALGGVGASVVACLGPWLLQHQGIRELLKRLPFIHRGTSIFAAYEVTARAVGVNFLALIGSLPSHVCSILMGYCALKAMNLDAPLVPFFAVIAIVNMLIALPVSIGGLGWREFLFVTFLALFGIDKVHAFAFSLTFFALSLVWSVAGGPFYFLYRHETHSPAPDIDDADSMLTAK